MQRQRDPRLARHVERRREGHVGGGTEQAGQRLARRRVERAQRRRRLAEGRGEEHVDRPRSTSAIWRLICCSPCTAARYRPALSERPSSTSAQLSGSRSASVAARPEPLLPVADGPGVAAGPRLTKCPMKASPSTSSAASSTRWPSDSHSARRLRGRRDTVGVHVAPGGRRRHDRRCAAAPAPTSAAAANEAPRRGAPSRDRRAPDRPWRRGWRPSRGPSGSRRARHTRPPIMSPYCGRERVRGPASASDRPGRSTRPGCGWSHRRRWRAPPAPCPTATAAAEPPEEPPVECSVFHGIARRSEAARLGSSAGCRTRACSSCRR